MRHYPEYNTERQRDRKHEREVKRHGMGSNICLIGVSEKENRHKRANTILDNVNTEE